MVGCNVTLGNAEKELDIDGEDSRMVRVEVAGRKGRVMATKIYTLRVQPKEATEDLPLRLMFTSARELREAWEALKKLGFRCSQEAEVLTAQTAETAVECAMMYFGG